MVGSSRASLRSVLGVFVVVFAIYAYFMPRWADWNEDSRLDLVHALVDNHTVAIDRYHWNTWDKAYRVTGRTTHYYSDKAPGTAMLGAVVYAGFLGIRKLPGAGGLIQRFEANPAWNVAARLGRSDTQRDAVPHTRTLGGCQGHGPATVQYIPWGNRLVPPMDDWALSKYVVTVGAVDLVSAVFVAFFFWFLAVLGIGLLARLAVAVLYALGTTVLPYATNLYSHHLSAAALFTAFALLWLSSRRSQSRRLALLAGLLIGSAFFTEYTVAILVPLLLVYGMFRLRASSTRFLFVAGVGAPVLALFVYNYLCFGSPLDTGYAHDYCWSAAQAAGIAGFTYPHPGALFDLTFGSYRGLLYLSPFLLLAVPGAFFMARDGLKSEAVLALAGAVLFILAISAYWGWNGGRVEGPRYLVPVIPFLTLPVAFTLAHRRRALLFGPIAAALGAWSFFAVWSEFLGGDLFPSAWLRNPIFQYSLPNLRVNEVAPNAGFFLGLRGWESLLPLGLVLLIVGCLTLFSSLVSGRVGAPDRAPAGTSLAP